MLLLSWVARQAWQDAWCHHFQVWYLKSLSCHLMTLFQRNTVESGHVNSQSFMLTATVTIITSVGARTKLITLPDICECHRTTIYTKSFEKLTKRQQWAAGRSKTVSSLVFCLPQNTRDSFCLSCGNDLVTYGNNTMLRCPVQRW